MLHQNQIKFFIQMLPVYSCVCMRDGTKLNHVIISFRLILSLFPSVSLFLFPFSRRHLLPLAVCHDPRGVVIDGTGASELSLKFVRLQTPGGGSRKREHSNDRNAVTITSSLKQIYWSKREIDLPQCSCIFFSPDLKRDAGFIFQNSISCKSEKMAQASLFLKLNPADDMDVFDWCLIDARQTCVTEVEEKEADGLCSRFRNG